MFTLLCLVVAILTLVCVATLGQVRQLRAEIQSLRAQLSRQGWDEPSSALRSIS